jgi:hypothetical protein
MAIVSQQITVTTEAQLIVPADNVSQQIHLHTESGSTYIGNSGVTSSTGFKLDNQDVISLDIREGEALYAVCASGTTTLFMLRSKID